MLFGVQQLLQSTLLNTPPGRNLALYCVPCLQVLPLVLELGQDIIWRVRRAVMVSVPLLTERMGVNYFEENLLELYLQVMAQKRAGCLFFCNLVATHFLYVLAAVRLFVSEAPVHTSPARLTGTASTRYESAHQRDCNDCAKYAARIGYRRRCCRVFMVSTMNRRST